jgi:hypothetical protein
MNSLTTHLKSDTKKENSLSLNDINSTKTNSESFRSLLITNGYTRFDCEGIKGDRCYDSYHKDFVENEKLSYTIFCYCYNLRGIVENPENFEFCFESQIETGNGILGLESVQWCFKTKENCLTNILGFEAIVNSNWKNLGSIPFGEI